MQRSLPALLLMSLIVFVGSAAMCLTLDEQGATALLYLMIIGTLLVVLHKGSRVAIDDRFPLALFVVAFLWKMIGSALRYWTLFEVYGGGGDAVAYHNHGVEFSQTSIPLEFSILDDAVVGSQGTTWMVYLITALYSFMPPSLLGSFFLFATLAFIGSFFFYRAFRIAFPDSPSHWYFFLVFFLPSILYWPSSLGKDAWIFFASGLVAFGIVRFIRQSQLIGLIFAGAGLGLILLIRPHIAAIMMIALAAGYLLSFKLLVSRNFIKWILAAVIILIGGFSVVQFSSDYFLGRQLEEVSWEEAENFYQHRQVASATGGSVIEAPSILNPVGPFYAFVTVMFRPFPWEAHNVQAVATSLETVFWLGLFWYRRKTFLARIRSITSDPWVGFCLMYSIFLIMGLTTAGNLGIIARQRVMFLPFLFMLFG